METVGTDAGAAHSFDPPFPVHHFLLGAGKYGLTQLANLAELPPTGAIVVVAPLKLVDGTGSPVAGVRARVNPARVEGRPMVDQLNSRRVSLPEPLQVSLSSSNWTAPPLVRCPGYALVAGSGCSITGGLVLRKFALSVRESASQRSGSNPARSQPALAAVALVEHPSTRSRTPARLRDSSVALRGPRIGLSRAAGP